MVNRVPFFLLALQFLLLLSLVDHDLLDPLDDSLVPVSDTLVNAVVGRRLSHETWLRDCRPVPREENASLSTPLANFDQFIFHKNTLFNGIALLEGAHDVPRQGLWVVYLHSFNFKLASSTLTQQ